ncbi:hypothetical protein [Pseudomonas mosselii]|uniref:hypothetical protein n=1 Tax=Pseudomonas mosselii TaxID=78327 RepID=UPI0021D7F639|nr:hypothetical protein [Pseudomonas mosselii]MCU9528760.1 hypothetical protein [Pseudomonas mosselii]MCU9536095.1 hypothetical protein [Pseudomonas mosselii]MCU9541730.1 hypothetical protein [Pseudomonas mosselii]MCU9547689.1 hypothetical protein [Pseudomonas mosselii]
MSPAQEKAVAELRRLGFQVVVDAREVVRVTRGSDRRVVMADGSQKRGHHVEFKRAGQPAGEGV